MPASYGTTQTSIEYMSNTLKHVLRDGLVSKITNRDYYTPGAVDAASSKAIKSQNQQFVISALFSNGWSSYAGSDLSFATVKEVVSTLSISNFYSLQDSIPSLSVFKSSVKDPNSTIIQSAGGKLRAILDKAALGMYADAGSGNWVGTSYTTGTVAVANTTGVVTGSGTTFTSAMVGRPFKAAGHSKWYRVKTYTSTTEIVIENDSDDETSAYDGGAISAGAAYEIQAATVLALTKTNIAATLAKCSQLLDNANYNGYDEMTVPTEGRFVILPASAKSPLLTASEFNRDIEIVFNDTIKKGRVAKAYGMDIYMVPDAWVSGNNTTGFYVPYGHTSWLTTGFGFIEPVTVIASKDNQTNFGDKIKGLFGYGFKVADSRRFCGGVLFSTFA